MVVDLGVGGDGGFVDGGLDEALEDEAGVEEQVEPGRERVGEARDAERARRLARAAGGAEGPLFDLAVELAEVVAADDAAPLAGAVASTHSHSGVWKHGCVIESWKKPPGASTRWTSASTRAWSGMSMRLMNAVTKSNAPSPNGSAAPEPRTTRIPRGSPRSSSAVACDHRRRDVERRHARAALGDQPRVVALAAAEVEAAPGRARPAAWRRTPAS